jgi:hypothetical protein
MKEGESLSAWADEFYKEWCDLMVARCENKVAEEQPKSKKIAGGKK